jgi:hypothetical protein
MMGWETVALTVAFISLLITILMQMASRALGLQGLGMWVKSEYSQVAVSFLIIGLAFAMQQGYVVVGEITASVAAASGYIELNTIAQNSLGDPFIIAKAYIDTVVRCQKTVYAIIYAKNFFTEAYSQMSLDVLGVEAIGGGFALSGFVSLYHYINNNIVYLTLFNFIQYNVLVFSQYTMLQIFLPIGLVLRAFPLTRGAGGLMVAFALGFAFVFPMTYVLIVAMMPNMEAFCSQITVEELPQVAGQDPCLNNVGGITEGHYKLKSQTSKTTGLIDWIEANFGMFLLQAIFYPLVCLTITFTFIRQTGSLFGADLAEIGRGLIKII